MPVRQEGRRFPVKRRGCLFPRVCRTRCFCTKSVQFRHISIRFVLGEKARRDSSVAKVSAEPERNEGSFQCLFKKRLQFCPCSKKLGVVKKARRDGSVCKASAKSEQNEGRFRCFCTKRLQFRPFSTKLGVVKKARRDGSVCKASAESGKQFCADERRTFAETLHVT